MSSDTSFHRLIAQSTILPGETAPGFEHFSNETMATNHKLKVLHGTADNEICVVGKDLAEIGQLTSSFGHARSLFLR